jgi:uncharacterized protein (DUF885 family)
MKGLAIDDFYEEVNTQLLLRSPQEISYFGLSQKLNRNDDQLDDISYAYESQSYDLVEGILKLLRSYDRAALAENQQISYDVIEWYLDDWARTREFRHHAYPISHRNSSPEKWLIQFLTDIHPIKSRQNARDYVARLWRVGTYLKQLEDNIERSRRAGIIPLFFMIQISIDHANRFQPGRARQLPLYSVFQRRLQALTDVDKKWRQNLLKQAEEAMEEVVIPAYHEAIPGHHFQITIAQRLPLTQPQNDLASKATEGQNPSCQATKTQLFILG